ncbi:unnamed protein product [Polarella glacialis]|uniref:N-acetyltransferase domain-containing protein n=1 Tax=Polarella glacialis TaxID=89957 RepID=A0A813DJD8_POLGL|nr:unnamed protein product [Polarella glacialis]
MLDKTKAGTAAAACQADPPAMGDCSGGECILVAADNASGELIGCVHGEWLFGEAGTIFGFPTSTAVHGFGMLSVPALNGGRGVGKRLVSAVEAELMANNALDGGGLLSEIDVIVSIGDRRGNLLLWYGSQGYTPVGEVTPAFWSFAIADEFIGKVLVQRMQKLLMASPLSYTIRPAGEADAVACSELINTAYSERYIRYKKPEYHNRVDAAGEKVLQMIRKGPMLDKTKAGTAAAACQADPPAMGDCSGGECILVAADNASGELIGCVHGEWLFGEAGTIFGFPTSTAVHSFGMLSVPARNGGRGVGKRLVSAVEAELMANNALDGSGLLSEIDVIVSIGDRRGNLLLWYGSQGYTPVGEVTPAFWSFAIADEFIGKVLVQRMQKLLV